MRIGIDIRNIGKKRTGDEVVFFNLVKNLAKIDSENEYLLFTDMADTAIIPNIVNRLGIENKPNFKIVPLVAVRPLRNKFGWNLWILPNYLRKNPVDIYHTQYITPFFVSKKIKVITTIHDISFNFFPQLIKFSDLFFLKILIPLSLQRADKIIAVSEFTREEIVKYYKIGEKKVVCAYNAISEEFFGQELGIRNNELGIREKYNLPEKFILYIGTLQPRKNLPALIKAYGKIKDNIPGIKLVLAGNRSGNNFDKKIDSAVAELKLQNDVIFPGYISEEDKLSIFRMADMFCFPSLYEGFSIPILEAMSQKVPVVCSDIPPHREVADDAALYFHPVKYRVSGSGHAAIPQGEPEKYRETVSRHGGIFHRVNPDTLDDLAEKMYSILTNEELRNELAAAGFSRARFFSWKKTAEEVLNIYKSLIGN